MTTASEAGLPPVSVIVASRNRPAMLAAVVESILANRVLPDEVVVVDQSDLPDAAMAADQRVRYVHSREAGLSRANNLGARVATHDLLLFTHDDVLVDHEWVASLAGAWDRADDRVVVTGRVAATEPEQAGGFAPALRDDDRPASYTGRVGFDVLKPMNMAMSRRALEEVGGFDPRLGPGTPFPGAEDADLGFRFLDAGFRVDYVPAAVVRHRAWRAAEDYLPLRWGYGLSHGAFYAKHLTWRDTHMARRMVRDVGRRARAFPGRVRREGRRALGDPVFVAATVVGAVRWRRAERRRHGAAA